LWCSYASSTAFLPSHGLERSCPAASRVGRNALACTPMWEVRRLSGDEEVALVAVLDQNLRPPSDLLRSSSGTINARPRSRTPGCYESRRRTSSPARAPFMSPATVSSSPSLESRAVSLRGRHPHARGRIFSFQPRATEALPVRGRPLCRIVSSPSNQPFYEVHLSSTLGSGTFCPPACESASNFGICATAG